jgi:hypothetical protein
MVSCLLRPSAVRRTMYFLVGWCEVMGTMTMRHRAELAWRSPPRLSRCRSVLPEDAGTGEEPQSAA